MTLVTSPPVNTSHGPVLWLVFFEACVLDQESAMATAVTLHETTKQFSLPGIPFWSQAALRNAKPNSLPHQLQKVVAVDHVSFSVRQGEIFGLVGSSGSGKTTLIRLLATLLQPDAGEIRIFGYDATRQPAQVQRLINRVSVEASFFKQLSPLENLLYGMQPYGMGETEALWEAIEILTRLGLEQSEIHAPMEDLPRSALQKVVVARALISRPRLLLLDEPTRGLDQRARYEIGQILRELRDLFGVTVLLAAKDRQDVESLCDRIATLENGRIVSVDAAQRFEPCTSSICFCPPDMNPFLTQRAGNSLVCEQKITC
jgi:ABC-2 type transport system ATP-binding protein